MRQQYKLRIRQLYDDGYSLEELAIMYTTSKIEIQRVLEDEIF